MSFEKKKNVKVGKKKGNAWCTEKIEKTVKERIDAKRQREYMEWERSAKQGIEESERRADEDFGR